MFLVSHLSRCPRVVDVSMTGWTYRGRRALVTGASAGIGAAFAEALATRGMDLVLVARREERLRALCAELEARHEVRCEVLAADLTEEGSANRVWRDARAAGPVHLVVNNAGVGAKGPFDEIDLGRQLRMIRLNVEATVALSHHALADMRGRGGGGIINVSSIAAFLPVPHLAVYAATKAFVQSFTESLWAEARADGVRLVALAPGRTPTEFQAVAGTTTVSGRTFGGRSSDEVVEAGLRALEAGRPSKVPGLANRLIANVHRIAPRSWLTRAAGSAVKRRS